MKTKFYAWATKEGSLWLGKDDAVRDNLRRWLIKNAGTKMLLTPDDEPSSSLRRFFEGPIVEYFRYQHRIDGKFLDAVEARKMLRREFNPEYVKRLDGGVETQAGSLAELNSTAFKKFVDSILEYMEENGYMLPDSQDFKRWERSAPLKGEIYPPLAQLIARQKVLLAKG